METKNLRIDSLDTVCLQVEHTARLRGSLSNNLCKQKRMAIDKEDVINMSYSEL